MIVSPRFLRPHTVTVKHHLEEDENGREQLEEYELKRVTFSYSKGSSYSSNGTANSDRASLVVDLNDYDSDDHELNLSINDIVEFEGEEFTVTSVTPTPKFRNAPEFLEVVLG